MVRLCQVHTVAGGLMRPAYAYTDTCLQALTKALPQAEACFPEVMSMPGCDPPYFLVHLQLRS